MIKFPFMSLQQLNLDWIMQQLHKILDFMPLNGVPGDVLQRNTDGAAWMPIAAISLDIHSMDALTDPVDGNDELPIYDNSAQGNYKTTVSDLMEQAPVQSVNGQTGDVVLSIPAIPVDSVNGQTGTVVLDASDVGALPDNTVIPDSTSDLVNDSGFVNAAGAAAAAPVQSVASKTGAVTLVKGDVGLGNVDNVQQYSASNPPPYPVTSVNGQTGAVIVSGGGFSPTLLWTNNDSVNPFAPQTISINLTGYKWVIIEFAENFYFNISTAIFPVSTFPAPTGYTDYYWLSGLNASGSYNELSHRACTISNSGITFDTGCLLGTYGGSAFNNNNQVCRPLRIWGIA